MFISIKLQNQIRNLIPNALTITVMPSPIDKKKQMFSFRTKNFVAFSIRSFCVHIMYTTVQINMMHSWNHHPLSLPSFHKFYVWWYTCAPSLFNQIFLCKTPWRSAYIDCTLANPPDNERNKKTTPDIDDSNAGMSRVMGIFRFIEQYQNGI
jgi:hypothetical protein